MSNAAKRFPADTARANGDDARANGNLSPTRALLEMLLVSGGDERIWPDPLTRRNRYGAPTPPAPDELWFSSSTAAAISERGYGAARDALAALASEGSDPRRLFDEIRSRIKAHVGAPDAEVILTASGTEAEFAALAVAKTLLRHPISNIVVAADETGSGVPLAATGAHFAATAAFEANVEKGATLAGWEQDDVVLRRIDIRDAAGRLRPTAEIDRAAGLAVAGAIHTGRAALLHLLDASKTGRGGPSRAAAREIVKSAGDRALVVVDACQLRCSFAQIKADLADGFLVMITGSKFVGGPPFCGALLIPADKASKLGGMLLPTGLAAYAAQHDWPESFAGAFDAANFAPANLGMGLRWAAALAEIDAYARIPAKVRDEIATLFSEAARRGVAGNPELDFLDAESWRLGEGPSTLFPIVTHRGDPAQTRQIYESLRASSGFVSPELARVCHVGQPVVIGDRAALRFCLSMPQINAVAERVARGVDIDAAFLPLRRDIEFLFRKWGSLARRIDVNEGLALAASNS